MRSTRGRYAIITGGGSGIGAAIALALAAAGADLCLIGRNSTNLEAVASKARQFQARVACCPADLACDADLLAVRQRLIAEAKDVSILVHSAATIEQATVEDADLSALDYHFKVNVRAPFALTQALLPMLRASHGDVVFVNSSGGVTAKPTFSLYDASKHALKAIADSLRSEVNADGVRVLTLFLGRTATDMQARLYAERNLHYDPEQLMQPREVASVVLNAISMPDTAEMTDVHIRPMKKPSEPAPRAVGLG